MICAKKFKRGDKTVTLYYKVDKNGKHTPIAADKIKNKSQVAKCNGHSNGTKKTPTRKMNNNGESSLIMRMADSAWDSYSSDKDNYVILFKKNGNYDTLLVRHGEVDSNLYDKRKSKARKLTEAQFKKMYRENDNFRADIYESGLYDPY